MWLFTEDARDNDASDLIQEMEMMMNIGHHINIINFLGCCIDKSKTVFIITSAI